MALIHLCGYSIIVDDEDAERIQLRQWQVDRNGNHLRFRSPKHEISLHRFILGLEPGADKCWFGTDRLDYRKSAFRVFPRKNRVLSRNDIDAVIDISGYSVRVSTIDLNRIIAAGVWSKRDEVGQPLYFQHNNTTESPHGIELLHRFIVGAEKGQIVDHISRDTLDNRRENLRFCTAAQNGFNSKLYSTNKSGRRGVFSVEDRWIASIRYNGHRYVRCFRSREQAVTQRENWEHDFGLTPFLGEVGK